MPTLGEVIDLVRGHVQLYIELKGTADPAAVVATLQAKDFVDHAIVGSFYPWLPQKAKFLEPAFAYIRVGCSSIGKPISLTGLGPLRRIMSISVGNMAHPHSPTAKRGLDHFRPPTRFGDCALARRAS